MMRNPSPHVSKRHKARLEKHLKQTIAPEKRLSFKESLLQQLVKMQKDANAGKLTFDASTMEALGECCFIFIIKLCEVFYCTPGGQSVFPCFMDQ